MINCFFVCANPDKFSLIDTSALPSSDESTVSILESTSSFSSIESSSQSSRSSSSSSSTTTARPYYPDTYSPGSTAGLIVASIILIIVISISAFCIRRQRVYYLPYYNNYQSV
ncbi:unnamed protein product [Rotaria magnacalcarata]|nr:unnamed protein product [Rotaria magnacalcarata]CAF2111840.1 unnamed protein product [Rotaria magnacalcarata]CAF2246126.1 unnamed protein product [Rotaria magnacalcarata]CAF3957534.1 unnamed protein product [Rotaria magnacalcarata]CAF4101104.1 unnamed protein product [Rotaria magnacalcarata]